MHVYTNYNDEFYLQEFGSQTAARIPILAGRELLSNQSWFKFPNAYHNISLRGYSPPDLCETIIDAVTFDIVKKYHPIRGIYDSRINWALSRLSMTVCDGVVAGYISTPLDDGECEIINVSYNGDELTFGEIERHQIGASAFYATYDHIRKCMHRICVTVDDSNSIIVKDIEGYFDVKVERTVNYSDIAVYNGRLILFSNDGYQHIFDNGSESVVASGNLESLRYVVVYGHIAIYFASEHDVYAERIEAYDMRNGDTFAIGLADDRMARSMLIEIV